MLARTPVVTAPHMLVVIAYGTPAPQGSKRHVGNGVMIESNAAMLRTWREDVKHAAFDAMKVTPGWDRSYPAVVGHFTFTMPRPRSHYRTGKSSDQLRPDAPHLHTRRPDLDKLLRSTWDALTTAGVYSDDSRVAQLWAAKTFTHTNEQAPFPGALDRPGVRIVLTGVAA
jgi:crossover junction endodeoxyribonuclease RusA